MPPGSREMQVSGPVKEVTVTVPKIAAVERRKARLPVLRRAGRLLKRCPDVLRRSGAPPPSGEAKERPGRNLLRKEKTREAGQGNLAIRRHAPRGEEDARVRFNRNLETMT